MGRQRRRCYSGSPAQLRKPNSVVSHTAAGNPSSAQIVAILFAVATAPLTVRCALAATCSLARLPDVAVTMNGARPLIHAQLNGKDTLFVIDSGAIVNTLSPGSVNEYQLKPDPKLQHILIAGVGGLEVAKTVRADTFTFLGQTINDVPFLVAGRDMGDGVAGLLGQNMFRSEDVEYDLANGVVRLIRPSNCGNSPLAYWAHAADKPFSALSIEAATVVHPHTQGVAYLNGSKIRVMFDTGSSASIMTLETAKKAGIVPTSAEVTPGGTVAGFGGDTPRSWIGTFSSFKIGDEEIYHTRLRFGAAYLVGADMLIGADFFLSHRIYVASSQHKLYFTYNGGPVFNLSMNPGSATQTVTPAAQQGSAAMEPTTGVSEAALLDEPVDAAGYARRAAASASRHDYAAAIKDLTRACELDPTEGSYSYQLGVAHAGNRQMDLALKDLDRAVALKPGAADARIARAGLQVANHGPKSAITADLVAADLAVPGHSDLHWQIGALYDAAAQPAAAVVQYSKWIDTHPDNPAALAQARGVRCRSRALAGQDLELAVADCDAALKRDARSAEVLESRGLAYLRQDRYDRAGADLEASLHLRPDGPWALYARGITRLRAGKDQQGHADIAAAIALNPLIPALFKQYGLAAPPS
jgi:tetratricopeptide (TPR) repeat protein